MTVQQQATAVIASGSPLRPSPTLVVLLCVVAPIVGISLVGWHYADMLQAVVPVDLTTLDAVRRVFASMLHGSVRQDSWGPMLQALHVLHTEGGTGLYNTLFFDSHVRFQYPPSSLLSLDLLQSLGLASPRILNAINALVFLLNAAAVGALVWLLFRTPGPTLERAPRAGSLVAVAVLASLVFYPVVRAVVLGQIQVWIDLLFTVALIAWRLERRTLAGVCIGLACTIKPQFGMLLLWGLLWRDWAFSRGILAALLPIALVSLLRYGLQVHLDYFDVLGFLSRHGESFFANNSVNGILNGYLSSSDNLHWDSDNLTPFHPLVYAGTMVASVLALAAIVLPPLLRGRARPDLVALAAAVICTVIGSPVAWEHHYGILLPIYAVALQYILAAPARPRRFFHLAALGFSWILVADFIPFANLLAHTPYSFAQAHLFFGALLLLAVLFGSAGPRPSRDNVHTRA